MSPDYKDFVLHISAEHGTYYAWVSDSPVGETDKVALDELIEGSDIEKLRLKLELALARSTTVVRGPPSVAEAALQKFGDTVFDSVFRRATPIALQFQRSIAALANSQSCLRVKLRMEAPELAQLPWEYLYDSGAAEWLGLQQRSPIIRVLKAGSGPKEFAVDGKLNILGMISNPGGQWGTLEDVDKERQLIQRTMQPLIDEGLVDFRWVTGHRAEDLVDIIATKQWHVFHFIGHGGVDEPPPFQDGPGEGYVVMGNEIGEPTKVSSNDLKLYLQGPQGFTPRLVVLNCCESAREGRSQFASPATTLIRAGIPAVVAMQFPISDAAAAKFADAFYKRLVENQPLEAAMTHARIIVQTTSRAEWGIPVLYMQSQSGRLFSAITPNKAPPVPTRESTRLATSTDAARACLRKLYREVN